MAKNNVMQNAKEAKEDEFYTRFEDIERELSNYKEHFNNRTILCNCDDPYESNFFLYFALNFKQFKLKKLITTCYSGSRVTGKLLDLLDDEEEPVSNKKAYKYILENEIEDLDGDGVVTYKDVERYLKKHKPKKLKSNGDFRSEECIELLKEADLVVTNPPFSCFRPYVEYLMKYDKKFIIVGNTLAISYKDIFSLIKNNKVWLGYKTQGTDMLFHVDEEHAKQLVETRKAGSAYKIIDGKVFGRTQAVWFTNLDIKKRHEKFLKSCESRYDSEKYLKYDNFDGIDIKEVVEIPNDYFGYMGVPITYLDKYNPEEFELISVGTGKGAAAVGVKKNYRGRTDLAYTVNGIPKCPFSRIIIKRRNEV